IRGDCSATKLWRWWRRHHGRWRWLHVLLLTMADFNQLNLPAIYGAAADVQGMQLRNQLVQDQIGRDAAFRNQLAQVLQNSPGGVASMTPQQTSQLYALDPERAAQFSQFQAQQNALAVAQRKQQAEQVV